jgi:hypothetical protein
MTNTAPGTTANPAQILSAHVGDTFGDLTLAGGTWGPWASPAQARRADKAPYGSGEWLAAMGPYAEAVLTGDGRKAELTRRCQGECGQDPEVRFERWATAGLQLSGTICSTCRRGRRTA